MSLGAGIFLFKWPAFPAIVVGVKLDSVEAMRLKLASGPQSRAQGRARRQVSISPLSSFLGFWVRVQRRGGGSGAAQAKQAGRGGSVTFTVHLWESVRDKVFGKFRLMVET